MPWCFFSPEALESECCLAMEKYTVECKVISSCINVNFRKRKLQGELSYKTLSRQNLSSYGVWSCLRCRLCSTALTDISLPPQNNPI